MITLILRRLRQLLSAAAATASAIPKFQWFSPLVYLMDAALALYFLHFCNLSSCMVDLDQQTSVHFWAPKHRRHNKPNLVTIHGYGGDAKWQFLFQAASLAQSFNLYAPDLVFFGKSYSTRPDRSYAFQAKCMAEGLKMLGVSRCSVYCISYGAYVAYSMAEMYPEMLEKMVIVSGGIVGTDEQMLEQLNRWGKDVPDLFLPQEPEDLRLLMNLSMNKYDPFKWVPDVILESFIQAFGSNRKEKKELLEDLVAKITGCSLPVIIPQETLLIWGDKDKIFPLVAGQQLQMKLGSKAKLRVLKDTGHAASLESARLINDSVKAFVLGSSD